SFFFFAAAATALSAASRSSSARSSLSAMPKFRRLYDSSTRRAKAMPRDRGRYGEIAGKSMQHGAKSNARRDYEWEESRESQLSGIGINRGTGDAPRYHRRHGHRLCIGFSAEDIARSLLRLAFAIAAGILLSRSVLIADASISQLQTLVAEHLAQARQVLIEHLAHCRVLAAERHRGLILLRADTHLQRSEIGRVQVNLGAGNLARAEPHHLVGDSVAPAVGTDGHRHGGSRRSLALSVSAHGVRHQP